MANPPRTRRKRVNAIHRAPDGSAFEKCDNCGASVPIALADMHECEAETKQIVKRFKGINGKHKIVTQSCRDQPRSPFRIFMEDFMKNFNNGKLIHIDRKGFETWRKMSVEEKKPYITKANEVNSAYVESLIQEIDDSTEVDEEADSATVGKFDLFYEDYGYNDNSNSLDSSRGFESLNTWEWEMVEPWMESWSAESSQ